MAATFDNLIDDLVRSYKELQERMSDPSVYNDHREAADVGRRLKELEGPYKLAVEWRSARDDLEAARDMMRPVLALYIGGMGARGANFYNALFRRYGYEAEAERIQELYLDGKQREAIAAVPDALIDDVSLVGPPERIRDRLDAWRESGATTLLVATRDLTSLRTMAELAL